MGNHGHSTGPWRSLLAATLALCLGVAVPRWPAQQHPPAQQPAPAQASVLVEPDAGIAPIYRLLQAPRRTLDMTMYELVDPVAEAILAADAARGVRVRVVLDRNREGRRNAAAFSYLASRGVSVRWAPSGYAATHEKAFVVDVGSADATAVVMTLNLTSRYYSDTRDLAVVGRSPAEVTAIESVFAADFAGRPAPLATSAAGLVWSPGAEPALAALIASARYSVAVESEEMSDRAVVDALAAAARSGRRVEIVMTSDRYYDQELSQLAAAGAQVHLFPDNPSALYVHAKVVVVDAGHPGARVFVGSQNFSYASLTYNRELGLITADPAAVRVASAVVAGDFGAARPYP